MLEDGILAIAGAGKFDAKIGADFGGIFAEDDDAVGEEDGLLNIVGDDEDGFCGQFAVAPKFQKFTAERLPRQFSTSSAEKGSSMKSTSGSTTRARAKPTRCFMPPESSLG